jgi:hypothetical protein
VHSHAAAIESHVSDWFHWSFPGECGSASILRPTPFLIMHSIDRLTAVLIKQFSAPALKSSRACLHGQFYVSDSIHQTTSPGKYIFCLFDNVRSVMCGFITPPFELAKGILIFETACPAAEATHCLYLGR